MFFTFPPSTFPSFTGTDGRFFGERRRAEGKEEREESKTRQNERVRVLEGKGWVGGGEGVGGLRRSL